MLKTIRLTLLLSVFIFNMVNSQCILNLPDTVCPLENITINTSLSNIKVNTCTAIPGYTANITPGNSNFSYQFKIIKEQNRYVAFGQEVGVGYVTRFDFNSHFSLIGKSLIVPNPLPSLNLGIGCDMVKNDSGKWIAMMPASDAAKLLIYEFDSLDDANPAVTDIPVIEFNSARQCKIIGQYLFVTNNQAAYITRIEFDATFKNILSVVNLSGPFSLVWAIDIEFDCISGNYYGFVADDLNKIIRMDFGPSLSNASPACTIISTGYGETIGIDVAKIKDTWYIFSNNYASIHRYLQFRLDSIEANPVIMIDTIDNSLYPFSVTAFTDSSITRIFASANFAHIDFVDTNCILSQNTWFEDTSSVSFNFQPTATGYQYLSVSGVDSNNIPQVYFDSIYVNIPPPVAFFSNNGTCEGQPIIFTDLSEICYGTITNWFWDFGDSNTSNQPNPVHSYTTGGQYTVTLTVYAANGDSGTYSKNISVVPLPVAAFTPSAFTECSTYPMLFTDNSTAAVDSIISWQWSFGNGDSATLQNPGYSYSAGGNYSVALTVTNSNGCVDTITKAITILPSPLASFSVTGTCTGGTVYFTNLTDSATNPFVNYNWYFGNGDSSQLSTPAYSYANIDSTYNVQLYATAANGCTSVFSDDITITHPALVSFTQSADTVCKNAPITFINTSAVQNINDSIISKHWAFSDGYSVDNVDTVIHSISQNGNGWAMLTIVTATFCDSSYTTAITVLENPAADFTFSNACYNDSNLFVSTSIPVSGDNIISYIWNFGDSTSLINSTSTYHTYSDTGSYAVTLTVISAKGCSDSITQVADVYPLPIANFITAPILCNDSAAQFTDFTYVNTNDTVSFWYWNFGNSNTATSQNPVNIYAQPGTYNTQLIVVTQNGCRDTVVKPVTVKLSPLPSFSFDSICHGDFTQFNFIDLSPSTDSINGWNWNFGEPGSGNSTLENPSHQFAFPGTYNVTVTAININQCFKSYSLPVTIHYNPSPGFTITNPCVNTPALFSDTSDANGDTITQWNWIINSTTISTVPTASYFFNPSGSYLVQLTITSNAGCSSTIVSPVSIYDNPVASFTQSPSYATPNQLVTFTNNSLNAVSYSWSFGDGFGSTLLSPAHAFSDTAVYPVSLVATSEKGCSDTTIINYNVLIPELEIAVTDVAYQIQNNLLTLSAKLVNLGNVSIENYQVIANVAGLPPLIEFSNLPVTVALPSIVYTLKTKIDLSANFDPQYFCIEVRKPNGIDDTDQSNNKLCKAIESTFQLMNVLPNPTSADLQLYINSPYTQDVTIEIYDDLSRLVLSETSSLSKGFNNRVIQTGELSNGVYYLRLYNGSAQVKSTFVKQ